MAARLAAGWITEEELAAQMAEEEAESEEIEAEEETVEEAPTGAILNG
jgi:N utilization substance protein A